MGEKPPKTKPSTLDSDVLTMNTSTPALEKVTNSTVLKKKRRCRGKKAATNNPDEKLEKSVTNIKPPKTKPSTLDSDVLTMNTSTPALEKVTNSTVLKKKRRYRGKKVATNNPDEKLKKSVTNTKRPKETASSNWQAFVASGLVQSEKSTNPKPKKCSLTTTKRPIQIQQRISQVENQEVKLSDTPTVDFSTEDAYVSELVPKTEEQKELTRCIAIDCEMVGVYDGKESVLARVSLVNQHGVCVYDRFVKPKEKVTDYRTKVSGVRPSDLKRGEEFEVVQKKVATILNGRILVGHAVRYDLKVLMLNHPPKMIRDTSRFKLFRNVTNGSTPALKKLALEILGTDIQSGEHSSVEDAKATMQLYNLYQKEWEGHRLQKKELRRKKGIEAAAGKRSQNIQKIKKANKPINNQLTDEFAAF